MRGRLGRNSELHCHTHYRNTLTHTNTLTHPIEMLPHTHTSETLILTTETFFEITLYKLCLQFYKKNPLHCTMCFSYIVFCINLELVLF